MALPTQASVTDLPCACGYLQRAADDPSNPIRFDELTAEYQFAYPDPDCCDDQSCGPATLIIYHCPFCGGAAPRSKRALLFAVIPRDEEERLLALLTPIRTVRSALKRLGRPNRDDIRGSSTRAPETDHRGPSIEHFRTLVYEQLSKVADVWITERPDGRIHFSLHGKSIACRST